MRIGLVEEGGSGDGRVMSSTPSARTGRLSPVLLNGKGGSRAQVSRPAH